MKFWPETTRWYNVEMMRFLTIVSLYLALFCCIGEPPGGDLEQSLVQGLTRPVWEPDVTGLNRGDPTIDDPQIGYDDAVCVTQRMFCMDTCGTGMCVAECDRQCPGCRISNDDYRECRRGCQNCSGTCDNAFSACIHSKNTAAWVNLCSGVNVCGYDQDCLKFDAVNVYRDCVSPCYDKQPGERQRCEADCRTSFEFCQKNRISTSYALNYSCQCPSDYVYSTCGCQRDYVDAQCPVGFYPVENHLLNSDSYAFRDPFKIACGITCENRSSFEKYKFWCKKEPAVICQDIDPLLSSDADRKSLRQAIKDVAGGIRFEHWNHQTGAPGRIVSSFCRARDLGQDLEELRGEIIFVVLVTDLHNTESRSLDCKKSNGAYSCRVY